MILIEETESQFQRRVVELAETLQWEWLHIGKTPFRPNQGVRGSLFKGWPDLTLLRGYRLLFVELKTQKAPPPTPVQQLVLGRLALAGVETHIWRPSDWPLILDTLTRE